MSFAARRKRCCVGRLTRRPSRRISMDATGCRSARLRHLRLGFGRFLDMLPRVQGPAMTTDDSAKGQQRPAEYERPTLVVIGNLKDLLAGSGSQLIDDQSCSAANGTEPTCP